jgi:hypothetical protein
MLVFSAVIMPYHFIFAQNVSPFSSLNDLDQPIKTFLPQPIQDILETAKKISEKIQNLPIFTGFARRVEEKNFKPDNFLSDFKSFWDKVNIWFENVFGVSLREIIRVIANFIVWVLEFIINLIKGGLAYIKNF